MKYLLTLLLSFAFTSMPATAGEISAADRTAVITAVVGHLKTDYVKPDIGARAAAAFETAQQEGVFESLTDGTAFATEVSRRLQALTGDGHLNVEYSAKEILASDVGKEEFSAGEMERWYGAQLNFGVQKAERLEDNTGLLDLRVFAPLDMGGNTVVAALNMLAHTDALIIDLRQNGGGIGATANLVASYLFTPEVQPLTGKYDRPTDTLTQNHTHAYVPGDRFGADKPVYVLISRKTFSAAEGLAYNLQALKRAVIVGEASGGGAHPFEYLPIHPHFVLWSVTAMSVHPITGGNWQGTGVIPDIKTAPEDALAAALADLKSRKSQK